MERLFTLDAQLLFDAIVMALSMLLLFTVLSYLLFNPVRDMLEKRKQRIVDDREAAKREKEEAIAYKEEYDKKLKEVDVLKEETLKVKSAQLEILERISGLSVEEAKSYLLKNIESEVRHEAAIMIKDIESQAKEEADKKARSIISTAIQKCAADHVAETTMFAD